MFRNNKFVSKFFETDYGCLSYIGENGDWKKVSDKEYAIKRVLTLLGISEGSYVYDPKFGVNIPRYIFEKLNDHTISYLSQEIRTKLSYYEKDFILLDLKVFSDEKSRNIVIEVELLYQPTNEKEKLNLKFNQEYGVFLPI